MNYGESKAIKYLREGDKVPVVCIPCEIFGLFGKLCQSQVPVIDRLLRINRSSDAFVSLACILRHARIYVV